MKIFNSRKNSIYQHEQNFAKSIDPNNPFISKKLSWSVEKRNLGEPTVPSSLEEEFQYNPFLRFDREEIAKAVGISVSDHISILGSLREKKNNYK